MFLKQNGPRFTIQISHSAGMYFLHRRIKAAGMQDNK